ncbi:unnamed protein product [Durusdinium trenchii]|uniref:Uncharacterized protein n=1 Tax=Durusdinium trenchii TaxID=1381693 RepID=A0ABP0KDB7_9DINO
MVEVDELLKEIGELESEEEEELHSEVEQRGAGQRFRREWPRGYGGDMRS